MTEKIKLPETYQKDIQQAIKILKAAGCTEVFLFGSLANGQITDEADIDLAISGCPQGKFFHLLGQLLLNLEHPVDLINLDSQDEFTRYLERQGDLRRID